MLPLCVLVLYLSLSGCDKPGVAIESPAAAILGFQTRVKDPLSFRLYINNELFDQQYPYVKYYQNPIQVRITETASERVIFDDSFPVSTYSGNFNITVYQYRSGSIPVCVLPPEEESLPPEGYGKVAFLYDFTDFPEEIKAVVENTTAEEPGVHKPTDTLIVRKNEFSGFFLGRLGSAVASYQRPQVKLYTTGDNGTLIGMISTSEFSSTLKNKGFTMYLAKGKTTGDGTQQIDLEQAY